MSYQLCECTFGGESLEGDSECGDQSKFVSEEDHSKERRMGEGDKGDRGTADLYNLG